MRSLVCMLAHSGSMIILGAILDLTTATRWNTTIRDFFYSSNAFLQTCIRFETSAVSETYCLKKPRILSSLQ